MLFMDSNHRISSADPKIKASVLQRHLEMLFDDIRINFDNNQEPLPESWDKLADLVHNEFHLKELFNREYDLLHSKFETERLILWSVGPNGENDLKIEGERIIIEDEIVLVVSIEGDSLTHKILVFDDQE